MRSLLFVFKSAPYDGPQMREGLEALFAARIFDVPCTAVLLNDAVYACIEAEHTRASYSYKKIHKMLASLPMYDMDQLLIHEESAKRRKVSAPFLPAGMQIHTPVIDDTGLAALFTQHAHILSF